MNQFDFTMSFSEELILNVIASRMHAALEDTPYVHLFSTPTIMVFQHELGFQIICTPDSFRFSMVGEFQYANIKEQIPYIVKAFSVITGTDSKQYFSVQYINTLDSEEDTFKLSKALLSSRVHNVDNDYSAAGIRLFFPSQMQEGAYDEIRYEPFLKDHSKWYIQAAFHCTIEDCSEVDSIINKTYTNFEDRVNNLYSI